VLRVSTMALDFAAVGLKSGLGSQNVAPSHGTDLQVRDTVIAAKPPDTIPARLGGEKGKRKGKRRDVVLEEW